MAAPTTDQTADHRVAPAADDLLGAVSGLRRAIRRAAAPGLGTLTGAQVDMLRVVRAEPGISVAEAATRLRLAPNTVSTLVGQLVDAGELLREPDPADRRVARLRLTKRAAQRIDALRARRSAALAGVIARLGDAERARLDAALPVLVRITELLEDA